MCVDPTNCDGGCSECRDTREPISANPTIPASFPSANDLRQLKASATRGVQTRVMPDVLLALIDGYMERAALIVVNDQLLDRSQKLEALVLAYQNHYGPTAEPSVHTLHVLNECESLVGTPKTEAM